MERRACHFIRAIQLPAAVDTDNVKGVYNDGVLDLTLPKKEEAKSKQVRIDVK